MKWPKFSREIHNPLCLLAQTPSPGASSSHPHHEALTNGHIYMFNGINLTTHSKMYDIAAKPDKAKVTNDSLQDPSTSSISPPSGPLQIDKPLFDSILRPPKSTICKSTFNPSSRATHNYNIVEDLAQAPCAMSMLEVLEYCPSQRRTLLDSIGVVDPDSSNNIMFNLDNYTSQTLPPTFFPN
jgi:hypothetical protein